METDKISLKILLTVIASIAIIEGAAIFLSSNIRINHLLITGTVRLLEILMIFITVMILGKGLDPIGLEISTITKGLKKGIIWSVFFGLAAGFIILMVYLFSGINPFTLIHTQLPDNSIELLVFLTVGTIIGPVAEELFFRGILYGFFRRWGIAVALISTTIIFILAHHNIGTIPATQAAGGIIFCLAYEIEESLMVPIIIHMLGNAAIFLLPSVF